MSVEYTCPHCKGYLCIGKRIILTFKKNIWKGGLLLLHPKVGNYVYKHHSSYSFGIGEKVEFHCPICHHNLTSRKHPNLAMIHHKDQNGKQFEIFFSKVAGEKSTFKMYGDFVEIYGKHANMYADLFSMSQMV
jgi:hypothetical protein